MHPCVRTDERSADQRVLYLRIRVDNRISDNGIDDPCPAANRGKRTNNSFFNNCALSDKDRRDNQAISKAINLCCLFLQKRTIGVQQLVWRSAMQRIDKLHLHSLAIF